MGSLKYETPKLLENLCILLSFIIFLNFRILNFKNSKKLDISTPKKKKNKKNKKTTKHEKILQYSHVMSVNKMRFEFLNYTIYGSE
jgi:hypothetical protein